MDPLSVSMAIVGLLAAAQKVSTSVSTLVSKSKDAPEEIKDIKSTVDTIQAVLLQLQLMLLGRINVNRQRTSLVLVDQIVITLSACVSSFSDLDVFIEALGSDESLGLLDRMRESTYKAEDAVDELSALIQQVLENHRIIAERLSSIEVGLNMETTPADFQHPVSNDGGPRKFQRNVQGFAFEEELENSWVYKKLANRNDDGAFSVISSAGRTASWSMLSGLSLADNISIIAFQALPVYSHDLANSDLYQFGEFDERQSAPIALGSENESFSEKSESRARSLEERLGEVAAIIPFKVPRKPVATPGVASHKPPGRVFGVDLQQSMEYANVSISVSDADGKQYIYGFVPTVVAKSGVFLKEKGTTHENIFSQSGSPTRIHKLAVLFDSPPRYGKGIDWEDPKGLDVYDAAGCLLRYLKLLPEPVIPFVFYDQFTGILEQDLDVTATIQAFQKVIRLTPVLNRQLLLYLLDILAVFAEHSDKNLMTTERLVAAFQPALLSRVPSAMSAEDHILAAKVIVFMTENEDHFWVT